MYTQLGPSMLHVLVTVKESNQSPLPQRFWLNRDRGVRVREARQRAVDTPPSPAPAASSPPPAASSAAASLLRSFAL